MKRNWKRKKKSLERSKLFIVTDSSKIRTRQITRIGITVKRPCPPLGSLCGVVWMLDTVRMLALRGCSEPRLEAPHLSFVTTLIVKVDESKSITRRDHLMDCPPRGDRPRDQPSFQPPGVLDARSRNRAPTRGHGLFHAFPFSTDSRAIRGPDSLESA